VSFFERHRRPVLFVIGFVIGAAMAQAYFSI